MTVFILMGVLIQTNLFGNNIKIDRYTEAFKKAEDCFTQKRKLLKRVRSSKYDINKSRIFCESLIIREGL